MFPNSGPAARPNPRDRLLIPIRPGSRLPNLGEKRRAVKQTRSPASFHECGAVILPARPGGRGRLEGCATRLEMRRLPDSGPGCTNTVCPMCPRTGWKSAVPAACNTFVTSAAHYCREARGRTQAAAELRMERIARPADFAAGSQFATGWDILLSTKQEPV